MGKLIIFEGLDGSGKGTQAELACQNLHSKGYDPLKISFPDYDSPSSALGQDVSFRRVRPAPG